MIVTKDVCFEYNASHRWHFPDILIDAGGSMLISGLSGSGKTTFMHILAGILKPLSGKVFVNDTDIYRLSSGALDKFRGRHIGLVFQTPHFIRSLSVAENLGIAMKLAGNKVHTPRIQELLTRLQLDQYAKSPAYKLSTGERQRLSIARALVNSPAVLLADEPTSSLDDLRSSRVIELLKQLCVEQGSSLVIISHDTRLKSHFASQTIIHS
ncbi:ABC transporter ATP-binding protein [Saprospiraceae bacterium]